MSEHNNSIDTARYWKDEDYRESLDLAQLGNLPQNPAGSIELTDADLDEITGAATGCSITAGCCNIGVTCVGFTQCGSVCNTNGWSLINCCY